MCDSWFGQRSHVLGEVCLQSMVRCRKEKRVFYAGKFTLVALRSWKYKLTQHISVGKGNECVYQYTCLYACNLKIPRSAMLSARSAVHARRPVHTQPAFMRPAHWIRCASNETVKADWTFSNRQLDITHHFTGTNLLIFRRDQRRRHEPTILFRMMCPKPWPGFLIRVLLHVECNCLKWPLLLPRSCQSFATLGCLWKIWTAHHGSQSQVCR